MSDPKDIFISYRRSESKWAAITLFHTLQTHFPSSKIFYDGDAIKPGHNWPAKLREGLDQCGVLLALMGESWATEPHPEFGGYRLHYEEDWVRNEIAHAFQNNKTVVPILIDNATLPPDERALPTCLREILNQQAEALRPGKEQQDLDALVARLKDILPAEAQIVPTKAVSIDRETAPDVVDVEIAADVLAVIADDGETLHAIGLAQATSGQVAFARPILQKAINILRETHGEDGRWTISAQHNYACTLLDLERPDEAEPILRGLVPKMLEVYGAKHANFLANLFEHARALIDSGQPDPAESNLNDLLRELTTTLGPDHPNTLATRRLLVRAQLELGKIEDAEATLAALCGDRKKWSRRARAKTAMLDGWLADIRSNPEVAEIYLKQAETELADQPKEFYMRRELDRYLETRTPGGPGGTMIAAEYCK